MNQMLYTSNHLYLNHLVHNIKHFFGYPSTLILRFFKQSQITGDADANQGYAIGQNQPKNNSRSQQNSDMRSTHYKKFVHDLIQTMLYVTWYRQS